MASWVDKKKRENEEGTIPNDTPVNIASLNPEQRIIFDSYVSAYQSILSGLPSDQQLYNIDGTAGCGKMYVIRAICQELRRMASDCGLPDPIRVLAPSGVAALNILGRTIHSALGLPINSNFIELKGMISTGLG